MIRAANCTTIILFVALSAVVIGQQARPSGRGARSSSGALPASAVTLVTYIISSTDQGADPGLLVIWRGSPGWFFKGPRQSSGGGSRDGYTATMSYGDTELSLALTSGPRSVTVQGSTTEIGANTVVLVDDVDGVGGARVVGTARVDLTGVRGHMDLAQLGYVLKASPEAVAFLKCDVELETEARRAATAQVCRAIAGG